MGETKKMKELESMRSFRIMLLDFGFLRFSLGILRFSGYIYGSFQKNKLRC